jgi:sugar transferase (PEP-CTERM/EpsH1 system associated)
MQRREVEFQQRFDLCSCTTPDELDTLRSYGTPTRSGWFPNGVDTEYFRPTDEPYDPDTICFLGRMDYYPNQECVIRFCAETLPRLWQRRPRVKLLIVGASPSQAVQRLGNQPGVVVTGSVGDVRRYVRRSALSIAPLRIARGTQNKILESLAMGVPVVCSPIAARGVDAVPGEHLLTAGDAAENVEIILRLLANPAERRRFAEAGRSRMLSHHGWDRSMRQLDGLIEECVAANSNSEIRSSKPIRTAKFE